MRIGMAQMDISWENIEDSRGESGRLSCFSGNDADGFFNECGRDRRKIRRSETFF